MLVTHSDLSLLGTGHSTAESQRTPPPATSTSTDTYSRNLNYYYIGHENSYGATCIVYDTRLSLSAEERRLAAAPGSVREGRSEVRCTVDGSQTLSLGLAAACRLPRRNCTPRRKSPPMCSRSFGYRLELVGARRCSVYSTKYDA